MTTVLVTFGTRPEVVKLAPLIKELKARPNCRVLVCATAQHRQLLDQMVQDFDLTVDFDLNVMNPGQSPNDVLADVVVKLAKLIEQVKPDVVVVQGDTTSVLASALAAFHARIPVAHVEAGLRSHDLQQPFPEEMNRRAVSVMASYHFCPTAGNRLHLLEEGVAPANIWVTGNTVVDAVHQMAASIPKTAATDQLPVLVTLHRRESFGKPLVLMCRALQQCLTLDERLMLTIPVHPNPEVGQTLRAELGDHPRVKLIDPVGYRDFIGLLQSSAFVLSDSGGVQEEGPSLNVPVLVLRDVTERPEAIETGAVRLIGTNPEDIIKNVRELLDPQVRQQMSEAINPYGEGQAAKLIADVLLGDT